MGFSTADVISKTREILFDKSQPYRWDDAVMRDNLQIAVKRLNARVPTTRYIGDSLVDFVEIPASQNDVIPIADVYEEPLTYYVAHLCYCVDDPDTSNAELANTFLAKAERLMV